MDHIQIRANAKINLTLDILNRREDGYHDIRSVMQSVGLCDLVGIRRTDDGSVTVTDDSGKLPKGADNLACRAAAAFFAAAGVKNPGIAIHIVKRIPMQAGLAGGSADAAAVLYGLNLLLGCDIKAEKLAEIGRTVGADVPFCLTGGTMLAEGVGDRLTPAAPLPDCHLLLAKPSAGISTKEAYAKFDREGCGERPDTGRMLETLRQKNLPGVADLTLNVMEKLAELPQIRKIEEQMFAAGALGSGMSGSGPTVFGIFAYLYNAERCMVGIRGKGVETYLAFPARCGCEVADDASGAPAGI